MAFMSGCPLTPLMDVLIRSPTMGSIGFHSFDFHEDRGSEIVLVFEFLLLAVVSAIRFCSAVVATPLGVALCLIWRFGALVWLALVLLVLSLPLLAFAFDGR